MEQSMSMLEDNNARHFRSGSASEWAGEDERGLVPSPELEPETMTKDDISRVISEVDTEGQ